MFAFLWSKIDDLLGNTSLLSDFGTFFVVISKIYGIIESKMCKTEHGNLEVEDHVVLNGQLVVVYAKIYDMSVISSLL